MNKEVLKIREELHLKWATEMANRDLVSPPSRHELSRLGIVPWDRGFDAGWKIGVTTPRNAEDALRKKYNELFEVAEAYHRLMDRFGPAAHMKLGDVLENQGVKVRHKPVGTKP